MPPKLGSGTLQEKKKTESLFGSQKSKNILIDLISIQKDETKELESNKNEDSH